MYPIFVTVLRGFTAVDDAADRAEGSFELSVMSSTMKVLNLKPRVMEWLVAQIFTFLALAFDIAMFITTPVHILVLITLWKNRNEETLKHAFFKLMMSIGIADIGTTLNIFLTFRLAEWGWAPQIYISLGGMSSRIASSGKFLFGNSQALGVLVVAINRFTAYMMPMRHKQLWRDGKLLTWSIAASWIISFLSIIPILFFFEYQIYISTDDPTNRTIYLQWVNPTHLLYYAIPVVVICKGLLILFIFIIYGIVFVSSFKARRSNARPATVAEKAALNMSIVGFIHCIGFVIAWIFFVAQEISYFGFQHNLADISTINFVNNLGNDLFSATNPYALLIFSVSVRTQFCKLYHIPKISIPFLKKRKVAPLGGESIQTTRHIDRNVEL